MQFVVFVFIAFVVVRMFISFSRPRKPGRRTDRSFRGGTYTPPLMQDDFQQHMHHPHTGFQQQDELFQQQASMFQSDSTHHDTQHHHQDSTHHTSHSGADFSSGNDFSAGFSSGSDFSSGADTSSHHHSH